MSIAPEIPETLSPYWLRLYGQWIHLEGIRPDNDLTPDRAFSELVTVDGYRYVQRAPRGPRTWSLGYDYGTSAATAALESAAYDFNFNDPSMRTLFLDVHDAKVNMVEPDLLRRWQHPAILDPQFVINVGESPDDPIWQPSYVATVDDDGVFGVQNIPVRAGVTYTAAFWTTYPNPLADALTIEVNSIEVASDAIAGGGTAANPELVTVTWTAAADGVAVITIALVAVSYSAGLMFYEGDCPPDFYRHGRRMPCSVSVMDPALAINPIWPNESCNPCALPRETSTFVIQEVGMDAVTLLDNTVV